MEITKIIYPLNLYRNTNLNNINQNYYDKSSNLNFQAADKFIKSIPQTPALKDLINLFSPNPAKIPKGVKLRIIKNTRTIVSFTKELKNGNTLTVIKMAGDRIKGGLYYLSIQEKQGETLKKVIGIDLKTGSLISINKNSGKASIMKGELVFKKDSSKTALEDNKQLDKYLAEIWNIQPTKMSNSKKTPKSAHKPPVKTTKTKPVVLTNTLSKDITGILSPETQQNISEINKKMSAINAFLDAHRGSQPKLIRFKETYEPLVYTGNKQKRISFKYNNGDVLAITHTKQGKNLTRIIYTDKSGTESHYLIENGEKIVANLNEKTPWVTPIKYKYYTQEQLKGVNTDEYTKFLKDALSKYLEALENTFNTRKRKPTTPIAAGTENIQNFLAEISHEISTNINTISKNLENKAEKDAQKLADMYYRTLSAKLRKIATEGIEIFKIQLEEFLKIFSDNNI